MGKCAILVNSCDAYEDVWEPFFTLFQIMWKDCEYPIYLNTESKSYKSEQLKIQPVNLPSKYAKKISWSKRLRLAIEQIDAEYILMLLEDFFLMSPVRGDVIKTCIKELDKDDTAVCIRMENSTFFEHDATWGGA